MKKGEILHFGNITIAHRVKPGCGGKQVWNEELGDWVMPDPEKNLSDEILVKWPSGDGTGNPY